MNRRRLSQILATLTLLVSGVCLGIGVYTFHYARGGSYLSDDPRACVNCHIMQEQYDGWLKSSHHAVASCNDCHVPHDLIGKYLAKAENGYHHSRAFTFQDFPEPIRIKPGNARLLQDNCLRCHGELVADVLVHAGSAGGEMQCVKCHDEVGHGPRD